MRKQCKRRSRPARAPMMVILQTQPDLGLSERLSVEAMSGGWATTGHFDNLADCRDLLTLAAAERQDQQTLIACELALHALLGIKERHARQGKLGASGEEMKALRLLADVSEDFWSRQGGDVFARHYTALKRARTLQKASGLQA